MANGLFSDDERRRIPPVQEAVQVLSLRLPQVLGGRALAPAELLAERPGGGADALVSSVVESVIRSVLGGRSALGGAGGAAAGAPSASFLPVAQAARVLGGQAPPITRGVGTAPVALDRGGRESSSLAAAVANLAARLGGGRARPRIIPGLTPESIFEPPPPVLHGGFGEEDLSRALAGAFTPGEFSERARRATVELIPGEVLPAFGAFPGEQTQLLGDVRRAGVPIAPNVFREFLQAIEQEFSEPILARGTRAF